MSEPTPIADADLLAVIVEVVNALFVNGAGDRADRLVLTRDTTPKCDLGGWARGPMIEFITRHPAIEALRSRLLALQRVEQLPAQWERDTLSYPVVTDECAPYAAAAVRLCAKELSAALASPTRPEGR